MKIKTNIRAGQGGNSSGVDTSPSTSSGGANSGGVNSNKPVPVIYTRCAGY